MKKFCQVFFTLLTISGILYFCSAPCVFGEDNSGTPSMEERFAALEKKIERLDAVNEIKKVMGRYEAWHNSTDMWETYRLFADREDTVYNISKSTLTGYDNIESFFNRMKAEAKTPEGLERGRGQMVEHPLTTDFIEVAGDGQTAKATWISPGHETIYLDGKLTATWCYGKYAATFIKMNGEWKIWQLQWFRFFRSPYDKSWADQTLEEIYGADAIGEDGKPVVPEGAYFSPYTTDKFFESIPAAPQPYETWTEKENLWWFRDEFGNIKAENTNGTGTGLIAPGATLKTVPSTFVFSEGPAADADGNIYFSDILAGQIWKWSWKDGTVSLYKENLSEPNGLYFDSNGRLVICEMKKNRVLLDDMNGNITVITDSYNGKKLHMPNDLWIDPRGGIYFSDFTGPGEEAGEGLQVYYIAPDTKTLTKVTTDLEHPNGVIGTPNGKTLYIAELNVVWVFDIQPDGSLSGKRYFCGENSDGFTMDEKNNLYCTGEKITIYNPQGEKIEEIETPASNLTFGGKNRTTLFITARESISTLEMSVKGAPTVLDMAK